MRITAIFETTDQADSAAAAAERSMPVLGRRTIPLSGSSVPPDTEQPVIYAPGFENSAATGGIFSSDVNYGIWPFPSPIPRSSIIPNEASGTSTDEARLELDIHEEDADAAERLLINRHGRSITRF